MIIIWYLVDTIHLWYKAVMPDDIEKARSIRMQKTVWDLLDQEASRCKRSSSKQLEAILTVYYGIGDIDLFADPRSLKNILDSNEVVEGMIDLVRIGERKESVNQ